MIQESKAPVQIDEQDALFMAEALRQAELGLLTTHPNPRVGAVVVKEGVIIGRGSHRFAGEAHAEVFALSEAGAAAQGSTVYITLEPCSHHGRTPPCVDALLHAGVSRVVAAALDPNPLVAGRGIERLRAHGVQVDVGCLQESSEALNPGFFMRMRQGRPWMRMKQAMSLDGAVALGNGQSQWLTGPSARADVQHERAKVSAVMVGIGTLLADNPRLAPRLVPQPRRYPVKVILDAQLRTPHDAAVFASEGAVWIFHAPDARAERREVLQNAGAVLLSCASHKGRLDWAAVMQSLADREINEVLVEAGTGLASTLLAAGLVDEWLLYVAPMLLGKGAMPALSVGPFTQLAEAPRWRVVQTQLLDDDLKWTLRPQEH
ncbi:MAG: bifunctional diaminohydroxyphosphoribosylaminopyrimidine deaminase/5-amino-6-(5-phosphoribosylamino)uracil reductase RibD [Acidithiobacillus sp.]